jgi:hypothetical protein
MAYIRIKKINNKKYAYLVETINTKSGPRQKVKQYLGSVQVLEKKKEFFAINKTFKDKKDILSNLAIAELESKGFKEKNNNYIYKNLIFSPKNFTLTKKTKSNTEKDMVININQGYICTFTLQRLLNFKKSKDFNKDAYNLAKHFLEAGLNISKELFIDFYQKI